MTKVVRIINRLNLGGPTLNVGLLTKHLSPEFSTTLIAGSPLKSEESSEFILRDLGVDYVSVPEMSREINITRDRIAYKKIKEIISDLKPDIVHTHAAKAGALGRMAAINLKVPVIVHTYHGHVFHSYFSSVKSYFFLSIERQLAKRSSAIIAISKFQKEELIHQFRLCSPEKIKVIPLGFDLGKFRTGQQEKREHFRKKYQLDDTEIAIGIIGRLVPVKNHAMFLRAIKQVLNQTTKKIRVFIIGNGEMLMQLMNQCKDLGLNYTYFPENAIRSTITFTSWIREIDMAIAGLDIVALTSFNEGTPVSLIEAQASNKPVVTTNVGGIENVIKKNITALVSESNDDLTFAENLLALTEDETKRKNMSEQGWSYIGEMFHYKRLIDDMKQLYNQLLNRKA